MNNSAPKIIENNNIISLHFEDENELKFAVDKTKKHIFTNLTRFTQFSRKKILEIIEDKNYKSKTIDKMYYDQLSYYINSLDRDKEIDIIRSDEIYFAFEPSNINKNNPLYQLYQEDKEHSIKSTSHKTTQFSNAIFELLIYLQNKLWDAAIWLTTNIELTQPIRDYNN